MLATHGTGLDSNCGQHGHNVNINGAKIRVVDEDGLDR